MNKQQLIKAMATSAGIAQVAATAALNAFQSNVTEALASGEMVTLVGFGTFKARPQPARIARNPKTGDEIEVPAKHRVSFVAGKGMKEMVNTPYEFRP